MCLCALYLIDQTNVFAAELHSLDPDNVHCRLLQPLIINKVCICGVSRSIISGKSWIDEIRNKSSIVVD